MDAVFVQAPQDDAAMWLPPTSQTKLQPEPVKVPMPERLAKGWTDLQRGAPTS